VPEKVLLTGGTGFVGRHLREELAGRGLSCIFFPSSEHDLTREADADAVFRAAAGAATVFHLASFQAAGDFPARFPADQFHVNHLIHANVLRGWKNHLPQARLIGAGSSCTYPAEASPLTEDQVLNGEIHGSVYAYAATKRALLIGIRAYNDQYKLNGSYFIPPTLFGEYDDFHAETAHVPGALVGRIVRATRESHPTVEIWGDGTQVREFLYVKDYVAALLDLAPRCDREVLNVGPGRGTTIRELAEAIRDAAGYRGELVFNPTRYTGIKDKVLDVSRLKEKYGTALPGDIRPGIERTVAWYQDHYEEQKDRRKFHGQESALA
jgi:GDP-L-fucose synthase